MTFPITAYTLQPFALITRDNVTTSGTISRSVGLAALAIETQLAAVTVIGTALLTLSGPAGSTIQTISSAVAAALMSECTALAAQSSMTATQQLALMAAGTFRYSLGGVNASVAVARVLSSAAAGLQMSVLDSAALGKTAGAVAALCQSLQGYLTASLAVVSGTASSGAPTVDAVVLISRVGGVCTLSVDLRGGIEGGRGG